MTPNRLIVVAVAAAVLVSACATPPPARDDAAIEAPLARAGVELDVTEAARTLPPAEAPRLPGHAMGAAEAVDWTLRHHPQVQVIVSELDAELARAWQARLLPNPMASVMALRPSGGGWMLDYGLMQSLIAVLERPRRVDVADAALEAATARAVEQLLALARATESAWLQAVAAREREALAQRRIEWYDARLALLQRQQVQGRVGTAEVLALQTQRVRAESDLVGAQGDRIGREGALLLAMGLDGGQVPAVPDALPDPPALDVDAGDWLDQARRYAPALQVAGADVERARRAEVLSAFNRGVDSLSIGLRREGRATGPEVSVAVPLFDRGQARRAEAEAERRGAEATRVAEQRRSGVAVSQALRLIASRERSLAATDAVREAARQELELFQRVQASGGGRVDDVLVGQGALIEADAQRIDARLAVWEALLELAEATASALSSAVDRRGAAEGV